MGLKSLRHPAYCVNSEDSDEEGKGNKVTVRIALGQKPHKMDAQRRAMQNT